MAAPLVVAKSPEEIALLPALANRHGLITGATGTGKTVTLQIQLKRHNAYARAISRTRRPSTLGLQSREDHPFPTAICDIYNNAYFTFVTQLSSLVAVQQT